MRSLQLSSVYFEMDAKLVVDAILRSEEDTKEFESIIDTCRVLLNSNGSYELSFARRQANQPAHVLARVTSSYASPNDWHFVSDFLLSTLIFYCNVASV